MKKVIKDLQRNLNCKYGFCKECQKRFFENVEKLKAKSKEDEVEK